MEQQLSLVILTNFLIVSASASCFFPTELQGSYAVQYSGGDTGDIWYKSVSIAYDYISGAGECVFRQRDKYVLRSEAGCFKCLGLKQRSYNVLTMEETPTCHPSAETAWAECEDEEMMASLVTQSMLYRAGNKIRPSQCPVTGVFSVTCPGGEEAGVTRGEADTCPDESLLSIKCPGQEELSLQCLGHWEGEDGRRYLSLLDRILPQVGEEARPRWRCAVYTDMGDTLGLTMSNDSTCDNLGQEMVFRRHVPRAQMTRDTEVRLPAWAQGSWDSVTVSGGHIVHRSQALQTTHHLTALQSHHHGLYTVRVHTDCGDQGYACLDIMGRGEHGRILELRLGQVYRQRAEVRCGLRQDRQIVRVTQLRHREECPMPGEWRGEIPDGEGLCARSVTKCGAPHMMQYQVYNCAEPSEVYEDRLYECYGQYSHGGQVYTLTKRLDLQERQECFVGVTTASGQHRVMEAGAHCDRGMQPHLYGMIMEPVRQLQCSQEESADTQYQENDSEIEMKLLHPKFRLETNVISNELESNSLETARSSASSREMYTSSSSSSLYSFSVISFASTLVLLMFSF